MIAAFSTVSLVAVSLIWPTATQHREVIETLAGILLIGGFGMLGYGLECVLGTPSGCRA